MKEQIDKQAIEEMAHIVSNSIMTWANEMPPISNPHFVATNLYNAGYRKQREGEWIAKKEMYRTPSTRNHYCSNCEKNAPFDSFMGVSRITNYCPNCGAKMKGY